MQVARFPSRHQPPANLGRSHRRATAPQPRSARALASASASATAAPGWDARLATFDWRQQWYPVAGPSLPTQPERLTRTEQGGATRIYDG